MLYIDLILNLAMLVALSVLSGFIDKRWPRDTWPGVLMQGFLFGAVTLLGMLRPLVLGPGLIFDGRSIIISLCALFFGHPAVSITAAMAAAYRLALGGPGVVMGVLVILTAAVIGLLIRHYLRPQNNPPSVSQLFFLGLAVHVTMVALMFTLPGELAMSTIKHLGLPVILFYPLATILAGKILSDQSSGLLSIKALQESEERYKKLFEEHVAVKLLIDPHTTAIVDANEAAEKFYGWPRAKLKQMKISDINTLSPAEIRQEMEKARAQKKIYFEFRHRLADGSIRNVEVYTSKIELKGKEFLHSIIHDVTERKRAEEALRESELRSRSLLQAIPDMMFIYDREGTYLDYHSSDPSLLAVEPDKFLGKSIREVLPADVAEKFIRGIKNTHKTKQLQTIEYILDLPNGTKHFEAHIIAMDDTRILTIVRDVTERQQAEQEIRKLSQELEQRVDERTEELHESQLALLNVVDDLNENAKKLTIANESQEALNKELEAFSYSVSHDLRAPLRSIDGFSAALLEDYGGKLDEAGKDYLQRVRRAAQNMGGLIDDLLNLSRVSKADFHPKPVNLSKMLIETVNFCKKQAVARNIKVKIQDNVTATADAALLQVALANLIDNAFKFTGKKENSLIEFGVKNEDGQNVFYIRDNGTGFDMTYVDKLFGPFQRLHTFDEFEGTGIGLATVQRIIHRHGGKIWAESEVNKGAVFYFTLP
jgi:PAS domain S-box-containing protein